MGVSGEWGSKKLRGSHNHMIKLSLMTKVKKGKVFDLMVESAILAALCLSGEKTPTFYVSPINNRKSWQALAPDSPLHT